MPKSHQPSAPLSKLLAFTLGSHRYMSEPNTSNREGKCQSSWRGWTQTSSASWGGGAVKPCCNTSTTWPIVSTMTLASKCFNITTTRSFFPRKPISSATRRRRTLSHLPQRVFWGPGTGLVWTWRNQYSSLLLLPRLASQ